MENQSDIHRGEAMSERENDLEKALRDAAMRIHHGAYHQWVGVDDCDQEPCVTYKKVLALPADPQKETSVPDPRAVDVTSPEDAEREADRRGVWDACREACAQLGDKEAAEDGGIPEETRTWNRAWRSSARNYAEVVRALTYDQWLAQQREERK